MEDAQPAPSPSGVNWFLNVGGGRFLKVDAAEHDQAAGLLAAFNAGVIERRRQKSETAGGHAKAAKNRLAKKEAAGGLFQ